MNFDELGAALRAERERRGLSIEDVADHLKISARQLRALEEGDAASLPHPAYARGFLRSYAAYLGISPDEVHNALSGGAAQETTTKASLPTPEPAPRERRQSSGGGLKFLLGLVLLAACAYAGWQWGLPLLSGLEKPRLAQPSPPLSTAQPAPGAEAGKIRANGKSGAAARPALPDAAVRQASSPPATASQRKEEANRTPAQPQGEAARSVQSAGLPPAAAPTAGATAAATAREVDAQKADAAADGDEAASPGQHKVIITATEECWIHSNADKTDTRQFSLRKGDTFALTFARSLELKLGNAGGVRIRYDGQAMPPAGQSGQVRTVTFPPQDSQ